MSELSTTSAMILGMLSSRDWSAYELAEFVGRGLDELWPRAGRQMYNAPKKLVAEGLINTTSELTGRRSRTMYSITDAGRAALADWLSVSSRKSSLEFEGMVRVLLADQGSVEDLRRTLHTMIDQATASQELFAANARYMLDNDGGTFPERRHLLALSNRFMTGHFEHISRWAAWALEETKDWTDTNSPEAHEDRTKRNLGG